MSSQDNKTKCDIYLLDLIDKNKKKLRDVDYKEMFENLTKIKENILILMECEEKIKKKILEIKLPSYKKFIKDVKSGDYEIHKVCNPMLHDDNDDEKKRFIHVPIDNDEMYLEYCNYCVKTGEKAMKKKLFNNAMKPHVIKKRIQKNKKRKIMCWLKMDDV